jgi:hypothetical protein
MLSWNEIRHRAIAFSRDWKGLEIQRHGSRMTARAVWRHANERLKTVFKKWDC